MMLMVRSGTFVGDDGTIWEGGRRRRRRGGSGLVAGRGLAA